MSGKVTSNRTSLTLIGSASLPAESIADMENLYLAPSTNSGEEVSFFARWTPAINSPFDSTAI